MVVVAVDKESDDEIFSDFSDVEPDDTCMSPGGIKCDRCPMLEKELKQKG